jgi:transcriptional regulator with XRE-family HTH domain
LKDRSEKISRLISDADYRASYVRAKLAVLVPSQIRALRDDWTQQELADTAKMKQSRISAIETPGAANFNLETLVRLAAAFKVGLVVKFVSYSEMLEWENNHSQDQFTVTALEEDKNFLSPPASPISGRTYLNGKIAVTSPSTGIVTIAPQQPLKFASEQQAGQLFKGVA